MYSQEDDQSYANESTNSEQLRSEQQNLASQNQNNASTDAPFTPAQMQCLRQIVGEAVQPSVDHTYSLYTITTSGAMSLTEDIVMDEDDVLGVKKVLAEPENPGAAAQNSQDGTPKEVEFEQLKVRYSSLGQAYKDIIQKKNELDVKPKSAEISVQTDAHLQAKMVSCERAKTWPDRNRSGRGEGSGWGIHGGQIKKRGAKIGNRGWSADHARGSRRASSGNHEHSRGQYGPGIGASVHRPQSLP